MLERFVQLLVNGLTAGSLYACTAVGFTLVFGIAQIIYFAQCEMAMIGAFSFAGVFSVLLRFVPLPVALLLAIMFSVLCTVSISCFGERIFLRPIRRAAPVKALIVSMGFSIILQNLVFLLISPNELPFPMQLSTKWIIGSVTITLAQVYVIIFSMIIWLLVWFGLYKTDLGRSIRAVAQSRDGAFLMGIPVNRVISLTFAVAAGSAAVSGILMGLYNGQMRYDMGFVPGIKGFTVAILGGVGNVKGALLAGLLLGVGEGLFAGYISNDYKDVFAFVLLIVVLLFRPQGLLGEGA